MAAVGFAQTPRPGSRGNHKLDCRCVLNFLDSNFTSAPFPSSPSFNEKRRLVVVAPPPPFVSFAAYAGLMPASCALLSMTLTE